MTATLPAPTATFLALPDLASRALAGSVVSANDELFAQRENLISPGRAVFSTEDFGHKGKVYDGWETRRRREPGHDHAVVRLGVPGVVRGVVVDTSWFTGNYPPAASVEATSLPGHPSPAELADAGWETLVPRSGIAGDTDNVFEVSDERRWTHVRLSIYPDGGVARFRVHGEPVPDPRLLTGTIDLAALEHGGAVLDCSNTFYSSPRQLLEPGRARIMGEGWENARRRDGGNDHVAVQLCGQATVRRVEVDTSYFVGNAPGEVSLTGSDGPDGAPVPLVPRCRVQPDTRHRFRVGGAAVGGATPVDRVRLDVFPDGGLARLRVEGELTPAALTAATQRWLGLLPTAHARAVLVDDAGLTGAEAEAVLADRSSLPAGVVARLLG
ncbi:allantoicase [Klenkia soli]|uniref:Probable allantoicase n=1 Tax=Klenkia soli TaxID=1052260 RepID=A0A1H0F5S3_9ACTN|nr:allantoicase [Klenkia soli]SDN90008.1 allantoicase [Klenkia soli]